LPEYENINQLVANAKLGSKQAMATIYELYKKQTYGIIIRMLGDKTQADDTFQDVFVAAFKNIKQLQRSENFGAWLRRIVINECIRVSRSKTRWVAINETGVNNESEIIEDDWFTGIDLKTIHEQIKNLPDGYRQVFTLFAIENFSHREIAETLGISESTSKSQYFKARRVIKERLLKKISNGQV
jgi:RNA polymerase sigma-70 factor (ECF subfamily)